jgi:hypothetical protein
LFYLLKIKTLINPTKHLKLFYLLKIKTLTNTKKRLKLFLYLYHLIIHSKKHQQIK